MTGINVFLNYKTTKTKHKSLSQFHILRNESKKSIF